MFEIAGGILIALAVVYIGLPLLGIALLEYKATLRFIGLIALAFSLIFLAPVLVQSPLYNNLAGFVIGLSGLGMSIALMRIQQWGGAAFFGLGSILWIYAAYLTL